MATSVKFPVALWNDEAGNVTARVIDGLDACAVSPTDANALDQLKRFIKWHFKQASFPTLADFNDPVIEKISVPLRAQHRSEAGRFPSETIVNLPFEYVWGKRSDGSIACCLPLLNCRFSCSKPNSLKSLVMDEVRQAFSEATTTTLAAFARPSAIRIESISVRVDSPRNSTYQDRLRILPEIAIALGDRDSRRQFSQAWQRDSLVRKLRQELLNNRANVLLVGQTGIGKTTILAEAVRQVEREQKEKRKRHQGQQHPRFWLTNASRLIAGMQFLGQWEERVESMIDELSEVQGVLCIENLLQLVQTGSSEPQASLAGFFRHFMMNDELQMVAECTQRELEAIRRLLPGFDTLFSVLHVRPMESGQAHRVLKSITEQFSQTKRLEVTDRASSLCLYLHERFMPYDGFPGKCVIFWRKLLQSNIEDGLKKLSVDDVVRAFVNETGLPEFLVRDEITLDADDVHAHFAERIVGQEMACDSVTQMVVAFKSAMNDPARPIGVQLFCGPTGVGKTEMAKTLADYLFGASKRDEEHRSNDKSSFANRMIRLDMSEYASPGAAEKLLIDQHGQPSKLVQQIRQTPFVVLLLDEIEKAASEVFDALMTVFDEGRMVDRLGREANFCSSVIVLTSNLGASKSEPIGFDSEQPAAYEKEVRNFFRPEFFNRLDRVITFEHLDHASIYKIAEKEIKSLEKREGLEKRHLRLNCDKDVVEHVAALGYDRRLGARPLQRTIEREVVTPLARWLTDNPTAEMREIHLILSDDNRVLIET